MGTGGRGSGEQHGTAGNCTCRDTRCVVEDAQDGMGWGWGGGWGLQAVKQQSMVRGEGERRAAWGPQGTARAATPVVLWRTHRTGWGWGWGGGWGLQAVKQQSMGTGGRGSGEQHGNRRELHVPRHPLCVEDAQDGMGVGWGGGWGLQAVKQQSMGTGGRGSESSMGTAGDCTCRATTQRVSRHVQFPAVPMLLSAPPPPRTHTLLFNRL